MRMAASPHSQETVSRLFERNYVPVLWHPKRKCIEEFNVASVWVTGPGFCTAFARKYRSRVLKYALPRLNVSVTHRGDGLPANHCNAQFRGDGKSQRAPVHRSVKQYSKVPFLCSEHATPPRSTPIDMQSERTSVFGTTRSTT